MIDPTKQPVHFAWGKFFRRFGPYFHTQFWKLNEYEPTPPHSHEFMEMIVVTGGSVLHQTIHGTAVLKKDDVVVMRPGSWHAYGKAKHLRIFNMCFIESAIMSYVPLLAHDPTINYLLFTAPMELNHHGVLRLHFDADVMSQLAPRLEMLDNIEWRNDTNLFAAEKIGTFVSCLGLMARTIYAATPHATEKPINIFTRRAMELMESDTASAWSLQSIAEKLRINKSYLARLFHHDTGMTVLDFLTRRRAEMAAVFLINTDKPVSEIAQLTGWDDPNYFARRFRSFYGMSASEYRTAAKTTIQTSTSLRT